MAKMKIGKKGKKAKPAVAESAATPDVYGDGSRLYKVELDGAKHGAIVQADSKSEAREQFFKLSGINSTERTVRVEAVEDDHGVPVYDPGQNPHESERESGPGIINYLPKNPRHRAKPVAADEEEE